MRTNRAAILVILFLLGLFAVGVARLFSLRFATGDVYPPYSSLRTDPLGAKAFFESIQDLSGYTATRNYQPVLKLADSSHRTVFFFGIEENEILRIPEEEATEMKKVLQAGNRVVITLLPVWEKDDVVSKKGPVRKTKRVRKETEEQSDTNQVFSSLEKLWGFKLDHKVAATNDLWHTTLYFKDFKSDWETLESRGEYPAMIERKVGTGSLVLCVDSYFVSNEALRRSRQSDLLVELIGDNHDVVFDEVHLGVTEAPGVSTLARRYGLHGLAFGLLVLAALFVWQNACSFLPAYSDPEGETVATGKDSAAGFVNLLRRSIPASRILAVCADEWKKSCAHTLRRANHKLEHIQAVVTTQESQPNRQRNPVEDYRSIAAILKERK